MVGGKDSQALNPKQTKKRKAMWQRKKVIADKAKQEFIDSQLAGLAMHAGDDDLNENSGVQKKVQRKMCSLTRRP